MPPKSITFAERFWSRVNKHSGHFWNGSECWEWTGARQGGGYGTCDGPDGRQDLTHRIARMLTRGPIPAGIYVLHHCDYPPCCRPDHLFDGTPLDNMRDKIAKGRGYGGDRHYLRRFPERVTGERNPAAKLTAEQVLAIRARHAAGGVTLVELGRAFGVHPDTIGLIVRRKKWRHL